MSVTLPPETRSRWPNTWLGCWTDPLPLLALLRKSRFSRRFIWLGNCNPRRALQTPAERRQQAELDRMLQTPRDKATLVAAHRPGVSLADCRTRGRSVHPHSRRAGRAAVLQPAGPHAAARVPILRRLAARAWRAAGEGAHAAGDGERHPARPKRSCWREHLRAAPRRRRADERQFPRRGAPGRGGGRAAAGELSRRRCSGRRSKCSRSRSRRSIRRSRRWPASTRSTCCATGWNCFIARAAKRRFTRARRHASCRSSSISTWRSTATWSSRPRPSCARWTGRGWSRCSAGIALQAYIPDSFAHAAADQRLGPPARGSRRSAGHDPHRQRREHGDGARRGQRCAAGRRRRTRRSSRPTRTTSGCCTTA